MTFRYLKSNVAVDDHDREFVQPAIGGLCCLPEKSQCDLRCVGPPGVGPGTGAFVVAASYGPRPWSSLPGSWSGPLL
jgi:hypothetical protein